MEEECIRQAILKERERREYHVTVSDVKRCCWIAEVSIPKTLLCYSAITECTEHPLPCIWADFAFVIRDEIKVFLQNDFLQIGLSLQQSIWRTLQKLEAYSD